MILRAARAGRAFLLLAGIASAGCGGDADRVTAPATEAPAFTPLGHSGPIGMTLESSTPASGTVLTGCGSVVFQCASYPITVAVRLQSPQGTQVGFVNGALHEGVLVTPCLQAQKPGFLLQPGQPSDVTLPFIIANECRTPVELTRLVVEARDAAGVISRQEWQVRYRLEK